jgi:hypothetical protein
VHLLLGNPEDYFCLSVRRALEARNCPSHVIANPLAHPSRFAWRLDNERSASQLAWHDELPMRDDQIAGVFVRSTGWIDPEGWQPDDLTYIQSETQAALLAWLWSLRCPVINRSPSAVWYRPRVPLLSWQPLLRRCGMPTLETLVTNVDQEARDFGRRLALEGVPGAVYGPLTSDVRYLLTGENDWNGLAALENCAPVCLSYPHGAVQLVCVVGEQVVWESEPAPEAAVFEPALRRFAKAAGLAVVELAFASTAKGICVIAVESHPNFQHFGDSARQAIVEGIADLLTAGVENSRKGATRILQRTFS